MIALNYRKERVPDYDTLLRKPFNLKSPFRSTVPLLAYWADSARRLTEYLGALGLGTVDEADLTFEYALAGSRGRGGPSQTDLMIEAASLAVGTEAKYTEDDYGLVSGWLNAGPSPENRQRVLDSWLRLINMAAGCELTANLVKDCNCQLIHRTASVCNVRADKRVLVYHTFDPVEEKRKSHVQQLQALADLISAPDRLLFFLYETTLAKSAPYADLQAKWLATRPRLNLSTDVRSLLKGRSVATFGQPAVTAFQ